MNINDLHDRVLSWAEERGILKNASPKDQLAKTMEEVGELAAGICRDDEGKISDSIGDAMVCLIILADVCGMDAGTCLADAYNEISGRKGGMKDGIFVKSEDQRDKEPPCLGCSKINTPDCDDSCPIFMKPSGL